MTDKEKIRLEILRRRDSLSPFDYENEAIEWNLLDNLLNYIDSLPEEKVSEDLEEEIERCWNYIFAFGCPETSLLTLTHNVHAGFARHYAQWQKEQMMKDAIEAVINSKENDVILYSSLPTLIRKKGWCRGDKVKVIIVKEAEK